MAPPRCFQCGTRQDRDDEEEWPSCKGKATPNVSIPTAHGRERKFCSECVEWTPSASQEEYLCVNCEALVATGSTQQTAPDATQDNAAGEDELRISAIEDAYLANDDDFGTGDVLHYRLGWEGQSSQDDTLQPFYTAEVETPEQKYYRSWGVPTDSSPRTEDQAAGSPYYTRLCQGYWALCEPLAAEVFKSKLISGPKPRVRFSVEDLQSEIFQILASIPISILYSICGPGLRARKARDEELYAWLVNSYAESIDHPCIYMLEFTDQIGRSPTLADMREIVRDARLYADAALDQDGAVALRVDRVGKTSWSQDDEDERCNDGLRSWLRSGEARAQLGNLLSHLEDEMRKLSLGGHKDDQPMPFVLRDVGYTDNCRQRLRAQENLKAGSNPLMSLFSAIAQSNPTFLAREAAASAAANLAGASASTTAVQYRLHGDVIFQCFRWEHAVIAEILFTILAQSYTWKGRGFNGFQAGVSNISNDNYHPRDWIYFQDTTMERGVWDVNIAAEKARVQKIEEDKQKLADLKQRALAEKFRDLTVVAGLRRDLRAAFEALQQGNT